MHFTKIILLATTLLVSSAARADTVTYTLVGNATGSGSGIGNLTGDSVTYVSTGGYLSFGVKYNSTIVTGSVFGSPIDGFEFLSPTQYLFLTNSNASIGYTTAAYEISSDNPLQVLKGATLSIVSTPSGTSVTPEPSSFILLGTGMLGVAGAVRRRLLAREA